MKPFPKAHATLTYEDDISQSNPLQNPKKGRFTNLRGQNRAFVELRTPGGDEVAGQLGEVAVDRHLHEASAGWDFWGGLIPEDKKGSWEQDEASVGSVRRRSLSGFGTASTALYTPAPCYADVSVC